MRRTSSVCLLLFIAFQGLYAFTSSGDVFRIPDEFEAYFQVESLADSGSLAVPQALGMQERVVGPDGIARSHSLFFGKKGQDGRPYAPYGPGSAVLALPHHWLARGVATVSGIPRAPRRPWLVVVAGLTALVTSTAGALTVVGFYLAVLALGCPERRGVGLAILLGAATPIWTYGSSFYSEALLACALTWAAFLLIAARQGSRWSRGQVAAAAALLLFAGLIKATAIVLLPGFAAAALAAGGRGGRRTALLLLAAIGLTGVVHMSYNQWRFADPFDFGYDWAETVAGAARPFDLGDLPRGLFVLLATPGKSIFLWAPPLLLALAGLRRARAEHGAMLLGLAVSAGVALVFYGSYFFPEGGYSHGPRHLIPLVPLLMLPAAFTHSATNWQNRLFWASAVIGCVMALGSVSVSYLQDQALGANLARQNYYERRADRPGKPWNRYNIRYIPFASTVSSDAWGIDGAPGSGVDFFWLHLARARRHLPDCEQAIPSWFPAAIACLSTALLAVGLLGLMLTSRTGRSVGGAVRETGAG